MSDKRESSSAASYKIVSKDLHKQGRGSGGEREGERRARKRVNFPRHMGEAGRRGTVVDHTVGHVRAWAGGSGE